MAGEFAAHQGAQLRVDGGQYLGQLLHLDDRQPPGGQGLGHLQADVTGADNHRAAGRDLVQRAHQGEGVTHRVQEVHPVCWAQRVIGGQAGDRRAGRDRPGADHEGVVGQQLLSAARAGDRDLAAVGVNAAGDRIEAQYQAGRFKVSGRPVGQVPPVGDVTGHVVRDAADGEVRVRVRGDNGHLGAWAQFPGAQRRADPSVAAAHGDQVHRAPFRLVRCAVLRPPPPAPGISGRSSPIRQARLCRWGGPSGRRGPRPRCHGGRSHRRPRRA